jgi:hypothetical protein
LFSHGYMTFTPATSPSEGPLSQLTRMTNAHSSVGVVDAL